MKDYFGYVGKNVVVTGDLKENVTSKDVIEAIPLIPSTCKNPSQLKIFIIINLPFVNISIYYFFNFVNSIKILWLNSWVNGPTNKNFHKSSVSILS